MSSWHANIYDMESRLSKEHFDITQFAGGEKYFNNKGCFYKPKCTNESNKKLCDNLSGGLSLLFLSR